MQGSITVRPMMGNEEESVSHLALEVFSASVAGDCDKPGVKAFRQYVSPQALAQRQQEGYFILVGEDQGALVAVLEFSDFHHITMFFVAQDRQQQGLGRQLLNETVMLCHRAEPALTKLTVHATPNAIPAFERLGFYVHGEPLTDENGLPGTPMVLQLV